MADHHPQWCCLLKVKVKVAAGTVIHGPWQTRVEHEARVPAPSTIRAREDEVKVEISARDVGPQTRHDRVLVGGAAVGLGLSVITAASVVKSWTTVAGSTSFATAVGAPLTS